MFHAPPFSPAEIQVRLLNNGRLHQTFTDDHTPFRLDFFPVVKLFVPGTGVAWLLTEIDPADRPRAFGRHIVGGRRQLRHVSLSEIAASRGPTGATVTWDPHFIPAKSLTAYAADDQSTPTHNMS